MTRPRGAQRPCLQAPTCNAYECRLHKQGGDVPQGAGEPRLIQPSLRAGHTAAAK
jgi:hypothetical protein